MNLESELKLQSYLDGELPAREARKVADWVSQEGQAQAILEELKMTKALLTGSELPLKVPETPEFYWSKIARSIQSAEAAQPRAVPSLLVAWRRLLAPLAGVALIAFLTVYSFKMYDGEDSRHHLAVVENLSEHTGAYSFRSQSEKMFVVWLYDRSEEADAESEPADDQAEQ